MGAFLSLDQPVGGGRKEGGGGGSLRGGKAHREAGRFFDFSRASQPGRGGGGGGKEGEDVPVWKSVFFFAKARTQKKERERKGGKKRWC